MKNSILYIWFHLNELNEYVCILWETYLKQHCSYSLDIFVALKNHKPFSNLQAYDLPSCNFFMMSKYYS